MVSISLLELKYLIFFVKVICHEDYRFDSAALLLVAG